MITLTVELGSRSYPILIGSGLYAKADILKPWLAGRDVLIVTNEVVGPLYLERARELVSGSRMTTLSLPDGEAHKTMGTIGRVLDALVAGRYGRDAVLLALGGGVVGDITGFAAAIYQRGVDFVQVPTTLLAQVDSAVGGKTGVNHEGGKNLIGAFHQPLAVLADTDSLGTLPDRELSAGLAEVIKYGVIADPVLFAWLEEHMQRLLDRDADALGHVVRRACEIKADIVARDEREHGCRALLNLGHTFGHAIEVGAGYGRWLHGEAVAAGTMMASAFAARLGLLATGDVERLRRLYERARLPVAPPPAHPAQFLAAMGMDKKVLAGRIRLVLPEAIGRARITADFPAQALEAFLREHCTA